MVNSPESLNRLKIDLEGQPPHFWEIMELGFYTTGILKIKSHFIRLESAHFLLQIFNKFLSQ